MDQSELSLNSSGFSDEWAALAALTGFNQESEPNARTATAVLPAPIQNPSSEEPSEAESNPLLDDEDLTDEDRFATQRPLWSNPWAKGAFVAVGIASVTGVIGLFMNHFQNFKVNPPAITPNSDTTPDDANSHTDPRQEEIGNLKTTNGLGSQVQKLQQNKMANTRMLPAHKTVSPPTPSPASTTRVASLPEATPSPAYTVPHQSYSAPTVLPRAEASAPSSVGSIPIARSVTPATTLDPQAAWLQAQSVGSYGQTSAPEESSAVKSVAKPDAVQVSDTTTIKDSTVPQNNSETLQNQRYDADTNAIMTNTPSTFQTVAPGTTAKATLTTPIFWAQDLKPEQQQQRFAIALSEPLLNGNGQVALPAGTRILAQISSVSQSGMIELSVTNVLVPTADGEQSIQVPPGALTITGDQGAPIVAKSEKTGNQNQFGQDLKMAALGALSQAGSAMNLPTSMTTTTSPYSSSTSVTNNNSNIVGAALQGAFGTLAQQQLQRSQQTTQSDQNRPTLWVVPKGQVLQITVNQQFGVSV